MDFLVIGRNRDDSAFLSTRRTFPTREAAEAYKGGIAECYRAEVVESLPVIVRRPQEDPASPLLAALRNVVACPDYRDINTHEMQAARDAIALAEKAGVE